jgi:tetratricopeptide (TPR) repeat protein
MRKDVFRKPRFHLLLIIVLGILVYSNTFYVPFQLDDTGIIVKNPVIKDFSYFIDTSRVDDFAPYLYRCKDIQSFLKARYVGMLSFWANYRLGGLDVIGYHIINTAVHIINALLVYFIVTLTFRTPVLADSNFKERSKYIALISALFFVCHPIQTQAVTYIVQRFTSLATMFYMLSLALYIRWRLQEVKNQKLEIRGNEKNIICNFNSLSIISYFFPLVTAVLAMKTKEISITLPLMIALYEVLFFKSDIKNKIIYLTPFFITMLIIPLAYIKLNVDIGETSNILSQATRNKSALGRLDYLLTQFGVIATYIRLLFMPVGQSIYYDDMFRYSFLEPPVFLSFLFLFFIFCFGLYMLHRSRRGEPVQRIVSFGVFWFFIALSVESSVLPIMDVIFEHRVYLPSAGAFMAIVTGSFLLADRFGRARKAVVCVTVVVVLAFSAATYARNTVWQSQVSLWEDTVRKAPDNSFGHFYLGKAYREAGYLEKAIEAYKDCIELQPNAYWAHIDLAQIYLINGMADKSLKHYNTVIELIPDNEIVNDIIPDYRLIYNNIAAAYWAKGMAEEAIEYFKKSLKLDPELKDTHINIGDVYMETGYADKAFEHFKTAVRLNSNDVRAHSKLGAAYESKGLFDKAVEHYRLAAELEPRNPTGYFILGNLYQSRGLFDNAIQLYQIALKVAPDYVVAHGNLGIAYQSKGMVDKAIEHYRLALDLDPDNTEAHFNLGLVYFQQGNKEKAREEFEAALQINPGYDKARNSLEMLNKKQ